MVLGRIPVFPVRVLEPNRVVLKQVVPLMLRLFPAAAWATFTLRGVSSRVLSHSRFFPFGEAFACDWLPNLWRCVRNCDREERRRGRRGGRREGEL